MNILRVAGLLGFMAVALGAFGAHALKARLVASGMTDVWHTAVLYHLVHAVALLALALSPLAGGKGPRRAAYFFTGGIVLFSGSLYLLALGGPRWLGPVTPLGGLLFLLGWASLVLSARPRESAGN